MKKLSLLLLALVVVTSAVANKDTATTMAGEKTANKRQARMSKNTEAKAANANETEPVLVSDTYSRGGHVRGGGCATGSCHTTRGESKMSSRHEHSCRESGSCGVCHKEEIPPQPKCTYVVPAQKPPCLHKQVYYSWTCPTGTNREEAGPC